MNLSPRSFALQLAMTPGIGGRTITRVLARNSLLNRSPEDFLSFDESVWREEYRLSGKAILGLVAQRETGTALTSALENRLNTLGVTLVTALDAHYPEELEAMDSDPPGVLFLYGNLKLLDKQTFCVLSSRNARPSELDHMERLAEDGVLAGEVLVAGHDRPEYQRTAIVPLRWGSPRILCLDRGLFKVLGDDLRDEAFRAARLWRYQFDPLTDLVVSPFRPEADFVGVNNRVRDRLVGGLSKRLDFVKVEPGGNMAGLLKSALKAGRPVRIADTSLDYQTYLDLGASAIPTA